MAAIASLAVCAGAVRADAEERIARVEQGLLPMAVGQGQAAVPQKLQDRMRFYKTPGIGIAVIRYGQIDWARGYGLTMADAHGNVTSDTLFQAASISKTVTAMVVLRLVEQGTLKLDEPVATVP